MWDRYRSEWWPADRSLLRTYTCDAEARNCFTPSGRHDGLVEVVAVDGVLHLGRILLGMARPHHITQAASVEVRTATPLPMQVDGEPSYLYQPSSLRVRPISQPALMLANDPSVFPFTGLERHPLARHLIEMYVSERGM